MKKSELKQIIKEEIKSIFEAEDPINIALKKAMGFEKPTSTTGNRFKTKPYTFRYTYWYGNEDYDFDTVTVDASNEDEARELAYAAAKKEHGPIRTSKDKFELVK